MIRGGAARISIQSRSYDSRRYAAELCKVWWGPDAKRKEGTKPLSPSERGYVADEGMYNDSAGQFNPGPNSNVTRDLKQ